jgi:hypothetical protein
MRRPQFRLWNILVLTALVAVGCLMARIAWQKQSDRQKARDEELRQMRELERLGWAICYSTPTKRPSIAPSQQFRLLFIVMALIALGCWVGPPIVRDVRARFWPGNWHEEDRQMVIELIEHARRKGR